MFVHVITVKGKGHDVAEEDAVKWHAVAPPGKPGAPKPTAPKFQDVFAAGADQDRQEGQERGGNHGSHARRHIAQQVRAGLPRPLLRRGHRRAARRDFRRGPGLRGHQARVAIYSTFLQRAYDQVIHDVCIQNLPVVFAMDRGGVVGDDGRTHQGAFDISYLRPIPNMVLMAPKDENELRHMVYTAVQHNGPIAFRYPRGNGYGVAMDDELQGAAHRQG